MIGVAQTLRGGPDAVGPERGDCFRACVASVLELPLESVPHFVAYEDWWDRVQRFVGDRGLELLHFPWDDPRWVPNGYWLAGVPSLNLPPDEDGKPCAHCVVMHGDALAWDPNCFPDVKRYAAVDLDEVLDATIFQILDPARAPWQRWT